MGKQRRSVLLVALVLVVAGLGSSGFAWGHSGATAAYALTPTTYVHGPIPLKLVDPAAGPAGTDVTVDGSGCASDAGHVEVFFASVDAPDMRLANVQTVIGPAGTPWTAVVQVPAADPNGSYFIAAQCLGDGTPYGHPGEQVVYFEYQPVTFTFADSIPTTITTTTTIPLILVRLELVYPSAGPAGTDVTVEGSGCSSVAGHAEVFFVADDAPNVRLAEVDPFLSTEGNWSGVLHVPNADPSGSYSIGAQCWGDGYWQGFPGQQVEYFPYQSVTFAFADTIPTTEPTTATTATTTATTATTAPPTTTTQPPTWVKPTSTNPHLVQFGRIQYDSPGPDTGTNASINGEWFALHNYAPTVRNLKAFTVRDGQGHVYTFATNFYLRPGATLRVHTGKGTNTATDRYWGLRASVWNNTGDWAILKNPVRALIYVCTWDSVGAGFKQCPT